MQTRGLLLGVAMTLVAADALAAPPVHPELLASTGEVVRPGAPVQVGTRTFYAYGADLLEWSESAQQIVARTRMPARIAAVAPSGQGLVLTLAPRSDFGFARDRVDVTMALDGPRPGRGFWTGGIADAYLTLREARVVASGFDVESEKLEPARRDAILAALVAREQLDRTNAFLPYFRGQLLSRAGRRDEALKAFDAAADLPAAPFNDLLRLSPMLEDEDATAQAARAFEHALAAMRASGLRPERLQSQVAFQVLMGVPRNALSSALSRGDVARVDALMERVALAFPRLEGAPTAYRDLAAYMRARGREDLAAKWTARAEAAAGSVSNLVIPTALERLLPAILGMSVIAPLIALVVGLRRGARPGDGLGRMIHDLLIALAPLLATVALIVWANARIETVARRATTPLALLDDGAASPDVARFVEGRLAPSRERDALRAYIDEEARAARAGGRYEGAPPDDATVRVAFDRADLRAALRDAVSKPIQGGRALGFQHSVIAAGLMFVAGYFLGRRTPRAAAAAARVIPGGPESLSIAGPLLGGALLGALFAFAGLDNLVSSLAAPSTARYFGLESIATAPPAPSRAWAWAIVGVYLVAHAVAVLADRRRAR